MKTSDIFDSITQKEHEKYMKAALQQAKKAYALGEVPIGCVIYNVLPLQL